MTLTELRKLCIRQHFQIRFTMQNGRDCVITEQGLATVPGWTGVPDFKLPDELAAAGSFLLETKAEDPRKRPPDPRRVDRTQLAALVNSASGKPAAAEHEEE